LEYKIKELIYSFFRSIPDSPQMRALRSDLTRKMLERYYRFIGSGKTPSEAYQEILGYAQEIKDAIADAMRSAHSAHEVPHYEARTYTANTAPQKPKKKNSHVSIGVVIVMVVLAVIVAMGSGIFVLTRSVISSMPIIQIDTAPIEIPEISADSFYTPPEEAPTVSEVIDYGSLSGREALVSDAPLNVGYRDMQQQFSSDGVYRLDAAQLAAVTRFELFWPVGSVTIRFGDDEDFSVTESGAEDESTALRCGIDGSTLFVQYCDMDADFGTMPVKNLTIDIPRELDSLFCHLRLVDAELTVCNFRFAEMEARIDAGSVLINEVSSPGPLVVITASADATINADLAELYFDAVHGSLAFTGGETMTTVTAISSTGSIQLDANLHRVTVENDYGMVRIATPICPYALNITTDLADISLKLPEEADFTLDFDSDSGTFVSELTVVESHDNYIRGDGIARFAVSTQNGGLHIAKYA